MLWEHYRTSWNNFRRLTSDRSLKVQLRSKSNAFEIGTDMSVGGEEVLKLYRLFLKNFC